MGRRAIFGAEEVTQAGLAVIGRAGWASLSLAAVAEELSVTPMALYRLVTDAANLRRQVADAAGRRLPPTGDGSLVESLRRWAVDAYAQLIGLPGLAGYVIREWTELPTWLSIIETFLNHAAREGLEGSEAVHTVNAVFAYVLARAQLREAVTPKRRLGPLRDDPGRYPCIRQNRSEFDSACTDIAFRFGLDALTNGLRAMVGAAS
jgi:AcrR family transcriptional regulator